MQNVLNISSWRLLWTTISPRAGGSWLRRTRSDRRILFSFGGQLDVIGTQNRFRNVVTFSCGWTPWAPTVSVKIVGILFCLLALPMLVCKIWWGNCDKQHWEDEETGKKVKKQCWEEVHQLLLSKTVAFSSPSNPPRLRHSDFNRAKLYRL